MTLTPTPQTCTGNGQIKIDITNTEMGAVFEFQIYESSNLVTPFRVTNGIIATGNTLTHTENALPAGNFRVVAVQVVGVASNQQTRTVTIANNIQPLAYSLTQTPLCTGASIRVNVTAGNPATYELRTTANAVVIPAQASNVLTPVAAGSYNVVVTDVCGNSSSLGVTVVNDPAVYTVRRNNSVLGFWTMENCNTIRHVEQLQYNGSNFIPAARFPINVRIEYENPGAGANTVINTVWNSNADNGQLVLVPFYEGQMYNYTATFTDACGKVTTRTDMINAVPSARLIQSVASCGTKFLSFDLFQYHFAPTEITFTAYPAGFDPADYNTNFAPGTFTHTYNTVPSSVLFGNNSSPGVPEGNYTIQFTTCGRTQTFNINIQNNITYGINVFRYYSGCGDNEGSVNFYIITNVNNSQADDIQNVMITNAPSAFVDNYGALPIDVSNNIASNGRFFMNSLPAGNYTAQVRGTCGIPITTSFTIYDKSITSTVTPTLNCGSFNVTASISSYLGSESMFLQKYYPSAGSWGHPTTGTLYTEGTTLGAQTGMVINSPANQSGYNTVTGTLNNIVSTGQFRVIVQYVVHGNGTTVQVQCRETLSTFSVPPNGVSLNNYYVANCVSGKTELVIDAIGVAPLNYKIVAFNGNPLVIDNGTSPIFSQLDQGTYRVEVLDGCGNTSVFNFKTDVVKAPVIRPNNLCNGQAGSLFVTGLSFLNIEWTKDNDPTVIATGNTLNFTPFNEATDVGTYHATLTYSPNPNACIAQTLSFTVEAPQPAPQAGTGQTVSILQQDAGVINLFDYLTAPFDNFGDWTDLTNTGFLNNEVLDASLLTIGTYQFQYEVEGTCDGVASTIVTLNIISTALTAVTDEIENICAYNAQTNIGNVMDNDTESGPVVQANYTVTIEVADPEGIITVNSDGSVDLAAGAQPGQTYTLQYRIAEIANVNNFAVGTLNVTMSAQNTPVPEAKINQNVCITSQANVSKLVAIGTDIQWYDVASGGIALAPTEMLVDGTTYYASQTINGCESSRVAVELKLISCMGSVNPTLRSRGGQLP